MSKETYMIESLTREIIILLMEDRGINMREAMDIVYKSKTYKALCDTETGLFFQSPAYLYDELESELKT